MLKKLFFLFLLLLCTLSIVNAQTTAIPDNIFEQFLVDQGMDTNGMNGNILDTDAQAVSNLNMNGVFVVNYQGIEAFTNLTLLNIVNTDFMGFLDLSNNILLENLFISSVNNPNNTINTLDLTANNRLTSLTLLNIQSLTNLIFPSQPVLEYLRLNKLSVADLNISAESKLKEFRIAFSEVPINITFPSTGEALEIINFEGGITVDFMDLSLYTNLTLLRLTGVETETLILPTSSTLTEIRISGHKLTSEPDNIENVINLSTFQLSSIRENLVLSLDLSQNTALTSLFAASNNMQTLDVSTLVNLTLLYLQNNELTTIDITKNVLLKNITFETNKLTDLDVTQNSVLSTLDINENNFTANGLDLTQNAALFSLDISDNQIESLNITQNPRLSSLDISNNLFPGNDILTQYAVLAADRSELDGELIANDNLLSGPIPNFYNLYNPSIRTSNFNLLINNNNFHFGDFESQHLNLVDLQTTVPLNSSSGSVIRNYFYAPQAKVDDTETINETAGNDIVLTCEVRGSQNHYKWFKDEVEIIGAPDTPELILSDLNSCDEGIYHTEITSDLVPFENGNSPGTGGKNLILVRNDITLNVDFTPSCVTLEAPINGSPNNPINTGITWTNSPGACEYIISVGTALGGTDIINEESVGDVQTYNFNTNLPPSTEIFIKVTALYVDGSSSVCEAGSFETGAILVRASCISDLSYPFDGAEDVQITTDFTWEPANGADGYFLNVGTSSGGTNLHNMLDAQNVTSFDLPTDLPGGTEIFTTLIPYNEAGNTLACVEISFKTKVILAAPTAPSCSNLSTPLANATDIPVDTDISWNAASDATKYLISITSTSGNNDITDFDNGNSLTYDPPIDFENDDLVTVTITPMNGTIAPTTACDPESFTIISATVTPTAPSCTNLSTPIITDSDIPVNTNISWDAVADATGYRVTINSTSGNNAITDFDNTNSTTYNTPNDFDNDDVVTVTITPYNATGDATGCSSENFTIVSATAFVPSCTTINSPAANATGIAVDTNISWDAVADATGYRVTINSTSGNNAITDFDNANSLTYNPPMDFENNDVVTVTITPHSGTLEPTSPCTAQSFTIVSAAVTPTAPNCTTLSMPMTNDTDVAVDSNISWEAATNADGYYLLVRTASNEIIFPNTDLAGLTTFSLPENMPFATTIFITITPYNSNGNAGTCNEQSFTTEEEHVEPEEPVEPDPEDETKYGFSPDGDGINEYWHIENIEYYPENMVTIYNRWGDAVFRIDNYDNGSEVFRGEANLKTKMGAGQLPSGTYFFDIQIEGETIFKRTKGYLVIKR